MSYYMTQSTKSPFDEALERQKQPFVTTEHIEKDSISSMAAGSNCTFLSHFVKYIPSLPSLLNYRKKLNTTHPSSEMLPFWSTKYREEETYHEDEDEKMMIEAVDFVQQHHHIHTTSRTEAMTSDEINYHPSTENYLPRQQLQRQTQIINSITAIIAIIIISIIFILFIDTFIFV
jgi:hypothetical protein